MDGRFFGGQKLAVTRYNGEHYNKSDDKSNANTVGPSAETVNQEEEDDDEQRLEEYIEQVDNE